MNFITIFGIIGKLLPDLIHYIELVELVDQTPQNGAEKKAAVLGMLQKIYEATPVDAAVPWDKLVAAISGVIDIIVALRFKKKA